ncbi:ROK family transcriptional regulator [Streptomyces sp. NPDC086554]|uniref:ROK family transcriptional regulator n=1 Tax=Streptomyces sp. NPDC086554 TaxID=3154864 RepID=UPI003428D755
MSESPGPKRDRLSEVQAALEEMEAERAIPPQQFSSLAMLVTDASLTADEPAIQAAHDGLRRLYGHHVRADRDQAERAEQRGHLLGMLDMTTWALRRLPSALQLNFTPHGHPVSFLLEVAKEPGLSNEQLAGRLKVDATEISRIGRRLTAAGLVWKSRQWRHNAWSLTPRGTQYLESVGLIAPPPGGIDYCLGVKVRPESLTGVVTDASAEVYISLHRQARFDGSQEKLIQGLARFVHELLDKVPAAAEAAKSGRTGLGVEIGGHVATDSGDVVKAPNYADDGPWSGLSLGELLRKATALPTVVENDANAMAQLALAVGDADGSSDFAAVVLDKGIGAGLMVDGEILHGASGAAGEIGHVVVENYQGHECSCGNKGCLESVAGSDAIARRVQEMSGDPVPDLARALVLLKSDDRGKLVEEALTEAGRALGRGLADLLNLANPDRVVLYGPEPLVSEDHERFPAAKVFMTAVRRTSIEHAFSTARDVVIVTRPYDDELGARAAAAVAWNRLDQD